MFDRAYGRVGLIAAFVALVFSPEARAEGSSATGAKPVETKTVPAAQASEVARTAPASKPQLSKQERQKTESKIRGRWSELQKLLNKRNYPAALEYAQETLRIAVTAFGETNGFTAVASRHVGQILSAQHRPKDAVIYYFRAFKTVAQIFGAQTKEFRGAAERLSRAYVQAGQFDNAISLYQHVVKSISKPGTPDNVVVAGFRRRLGQLLRRGGKPTEALEQYELARAAYDHLLDPKDRERVFLLTDIGGVLRVLARFDDAIAAYEEALSIQIATKGEKDVNTGIIMDNLGYVLASLSRFAEAEKLQRRALAIIEATRGPEHLTTALVRANLANLFRQQGRFKEAKPLFEQTLAIYRRKLPKTDPRIGVLLDNYAGMERASGNRDTALKLYDEALTNLTAAYPENHPEVSKVLNNLALEEQIRGNYERAEKLLMRALAAEEATFGKDYYGLGVVLGNLGDVRIRMKKAKPALEALERAISVITSTVGPEHDHIIPPMRSLAGFKLGLKRYDEALAHTRQAVRAEIAKLARLRLDPEGDTRAAGGDSAFTGALYVFDRLRGVQPEKDAELSAEAFEIVQRAAQTAAAQSIAQIGVRFAANDVQLGRLIRKRQDLAKAWKVADGKLLKSATLTDRERDRDAERVLRQQLAELTTQLEATDASLARAFPEFATLSNPQPVTAADLKGLLAENEVVLQYAWQGRTLHAFAVTSDRLVWRKLDVNYATVAKRIAALRCGLDQAEWVGDEKPLACIEALGQAPDERGVLPFDASNAHALYREVLEPLADIVGDRHIIVVPEAQLSKLPFHVLLTRAVSDGAAMRDWDWLAKTNAVSVIPSLGSLRVLRTAAKRQVWRAPTYLGVANPLLIGPTADDFSAFDIADCRSVQTSNIAVAGLAAPTNAGGIVVRGGAVQAASVRRLLPLPDTANEICEVANTLRRGKARKEPRLLLGPTATETALKALNKNRGLTGYNVLHFATHGLVTGEVRGLAEPALVLTPPSQSNRLDDGLLTASEVASLELDADWVVLSACNTAAGQSPGAEALSGLARSFLYAGARSLLVSHWPVQSAAAVKLTTSAIRQLAAQPGLGRAEALRLAAVELIADETDPLSAHPMIWAPFVVVGEAGGSKLAVVAPAPRRAVPEAAVTRPTLSPGRTRGASPAVQSVRPRQQSTSSRPPRRARRSRQPAQQPPPPSDDWKREAFVPGGDR